MLDDKVGENTEFEEVIPDPKEVVNPTGIALNVSKEGQLAKLDEFKTVGEMLQYAEVLCKSGLIPASVRSPEKVVAIVMQGKELGLGAMTSLNNLHNIKGKVVLSVHAIGGLIRSRGIKYQIIRDFEEYNKLNEKGEIVHTTKITTIRFFEKFHDKIIQNDISYTWAEAMAQGLVDNWIKMPKIMLRNRCLSIGARFAAPEAMLGVYEYSEIADAENIDVNLDETGNPIQI